MPYPESGLGLDVMRPVQYSGVFRSRLVWLSLASDNDSYNVLSLAKFVYNPLELVAHWTCVACGRIYRNKMARDLK